MKKKLIILVSLAAAGVVGVMAAVFGAQLYVDRKSKDLVFHEPGQVPHTRAGLVLGCSQYLSDGRRNLFFQHRINAAADLYHAGRVDLLLVSGSHPVKDYDEPTDMMNALIDRGVPRDKIHRDFAGFRTLDSIVRARRVFGLEEVTIISQEFHVRRALCIARKEGMDGVGFAARDVAFPHGTKTLIREKLARVKLVMDLYLLRKQPKFLGDPVSLEPQSPG